MNSGEEDNPLRERRGGRKKGTPNKTTAEIREVARKYAPEAMQLHVELMRNGPSDVRQRSANAILDRAYGRPSHAIGSDEENPLQLLMDHLDGQTRGLPSEQQMRPRRVELRPGTVASRE